MPDQVVGEQFILIGNVDIPATTENTMKLLGKLGSKGYLPNIIQEVSFLDGRSQNRISLTNMADITIQFNSDRIQMIRGVPVGGAISERPFAEVVRELCEAISGEFQLNIKRVVLVREKMLLEYPNEKMQEICKKFIGYGSDEVPFEWLSRTSVILDDADSKKLKVTEVGRAQGFLQAGSIQKPFDTIRIKIEVGTDMSDQQLNFNVNDALNFVLPFESVLSSSYEALNRACHEE